MSKRCGGSHTGVLSETEKKRQRAIKAEGSVLKVVQGVVKGARQGRGGVVVLVLLVVLVRCDAVQCGAGACCLKLGQRAR